MQDHSANDMQAPSPVRALSMAQRLHAALMPDYNGNCATLSSAAAKQVVPTVSISHQ